MLASVELNKRENRDDLDFLQMNGYIPCSIYIVSRYKKKIPETSACGLFARICKHFTIQFFIQTTGPSILLQMDFLFASGVLIGNPNLL